MSLEEVKQEIGIGKYRSANRVLTDWLVSRLFPKHRGPQQKIVFGFMFLFIMLSTVLMGFGVNFLLGVPYPNLKVLRIYFLGVFYIFVLSLSIEIYIEHLLFSFRDYYLDMIKSASDIDNFSNELRRIFVTKRQFIFGIIFSLVAHLSFISINPSLINAFGIGLILSNIVLHVFHGIIVYIFFAYIIWAVRDLSRYEFDLYPLNPGGSEVVFRLSRTLHITVYIMVAIVALATIIAATADVLPFISVVASIIFMWINTLGLFALNHLILSKIISRAKWATLNKIQMQIRELENKESIPSNETLEHIAQLIEFHDCIKSTRNTIWDFRSIFGVFNTLLLPTVGIVISNLRDFIDLLNEVQALINRPP